MRLIHPAVVRGFRRVVEVVVGGGGTSIVAVAEMMRGAPPVTKRCAPCGSGPAGLPRYTVAGPGLEVVATTVMAPEVTGIVARANPAVSVSTVMVWSKARASALALLPRTSADGMAVHLPPLQNSTLNASMTSCDPKPLKR